MKNFTKLNLVAVMAVMFGSTAMMAEYSDPAKETESHKPVSNKKDGKKESYKQTTAKQTTAGKSKATSESGKNCVKNVEQAIHNIMEKFRKNHDVNAANSQLDAIPARIEKAVAKMEEEGDKMSGVHKNTLNRKLKNARGEVKRYSDKHKN